MKRRYAVIKKNTVELTLFNAVYIGEISVVEAKPAGRGLAQGLGASCCFGIAVDGDERN